MDKDERFKHIATDPKFRHIPKRDKKVKIDKRFHGMFKDEKFKTNYTVDKRGRPVNYTSSSDLKRYYEISSESDSESDNSDVNTFNEAGKFVRAPRLDSEDEVTKPSKNSKSLSEAVKKKLKDLSVDYARGEGCINTDSSSDDDDSESEQSNDSDLEHDWGELDKDAETTDKITHRLAVCNMDWDRIRAVDLMVLFNSFLSAGSHIESISIYPSEFGLQRMQEEEIKGPIELVQDSHKHDEEETEEGSKYHMEKLRQYQLNRLKYYYAVIVLDSVETANKIYTECDGLEYESTATKIDLRFIPDDTTFDHPPKETCDKLPDLSRYQPRFFTTTALQQAKVQLTWDETNPTRLEIAKKLSDGKVDDVTDADLQVYLASSSGEDSDDNSLSDEENNDKVDPINKYRALLNELEEKDEKENKKDIEMEVTWELNVKDNTEKLVKKKIEENIEKTPFQQYLDKRKEKRKIKREERKKNQENGDENLDSDMDIDMNDPYFAEEFNKPELKNKKKDKKSQEEKQDDEEKAQLELLMLDSEEKNHFNAKKIEKQENDSKSKKKRRNRNKGQDTDTVNAGDNFTVNVKDARFSAIFTSHHYNIDPTDPHYRKTKAMEALIEEKQKRREGNDVVEPPKKKQKNAELSALVSSVKRKTKHLIKKK